MISCTNIVRTYRSGDTAVLALRGVSLTVAAGEFVAIAGPSGSGKSTLLNIIGCLDQPESGVVKVGGVELQSASDQARTVYRRENMGFIFQNFNLIPVLTAAENVALSLALGGVGAVERIERARAALAEVGLAGMEDRRPTRLSGGQQQRVAIARALVKEPQVVLADEPTANLDSSTGEAILELMRRLNEAHGTTFVFSTHDAMVMEFSNRIVHLQDGLIQGETLKDGPSSLPRTQLS